MTGPALNLLLFALGVAATAVLFWPEAGVVPRLREHRRTSERVRVEDALKQIWHHEFEQRTATVQSLAGAVGLSTSNTVALVQRMQQAGLVRFVDGRVLLAADGRRYALQVIRAHRLWERYLADETGVPPLDWHVRAERREHEMTPEDADDLAQRLGHPRFDPHGDPIPTSTGDVPERPTATLADLAPGEGCRVVHIEDEPRTVYAQLVAEGIYLGMELCVVEKTDRRIGLESDGRSLVLAPIVAANVTIERLTERDPVEPEATRSLADLAPGESGRVVRISPACRGLERRRLMDLGIVPGTRVALERRGMSGGVSAYRVRGTVIALRDEQSSLVAVEDGAQADGVRRVG